MKAKQKRRETNRLVGFYPVPNSTSLDAGSRKHRDRNLIQTGDGPRYDVRRLLASAKHEAEALAWTTPFPSLFLPGLVEEKLIRAVAKAVKQDEVRRQTSRFWKESTDTSTPPRAAAKTGDDGTHPFNR